ncbi:hypothetical protein Gbth_041_088 [Gluconobacter thailandicus F149-1 = NBRC 100600]|uniref:Dibenzothiophene desulfurization protein B n=1 Tax=Gluconobacter thailandicus NBRC 3257 TaxID=1381097 RepID=A0ABQ0IU29_GLUTH|nr:ABC transporter substrate-binding protein [Gluconobacter thailandicus]KXV53117.1 hypothetical protein AD946_09085 [Gluconobacter thailandicus]GAC88112.1 dibenzothiophene desulfurization protein B [Gluconobacter thailandicus NBRC 3255]GAD25721.1 dibenzothiophene desulfurization protein B [Gluconobacter thailandicus NBRC 3257]GAN93992.1 hypothetical protein Gbth_041_088 [Gluconobacter thailandicus F149-1 = NBRC 100600]GBR60323.1 nitrate/sulfonate/bicarbonate ABC transporter substrate-binding 
MTRPVIHYTRCPSVPTVTALAQAQGLLEEEFRNDADVDFEFSSVGFSPKLDYAPADRLWLRNAGHAPAVWKRSLGVACKVVGLAFLEGRYPVLALHGAGIASPADLKGRRVAVFHNPDSPFDLMVAQQLKIYQSALQSAGLSLNDVEPVYLPRFRPGAAKGGFLLSLFQKGLEALEAGEVDAVAASIPPDGGFYPQLNVVYDTRLAPERIQRVHPSVLRGLVVSQALLDERRDLVVRIVERLIEASERAARAPLDALRTLAGDLGQAPETLAAVYENIPQGVRLDLNDDYVASLATQKEFLLRHRLIEHDFDLESWIDYSILADATVLHRQRQALNAEI